MSASYDEHAEGDRRWPHSAFNPWLETNFPNGVNSNCMTCHQRAGNNGTLFLPITRGPPPATDKAFKPGTVRADFLWSIPDNAVPVNGH
jgi:hypothetical protein